MSEGHWLEPVRWNAEAQRLETRYRVFCASMADIFEERAPDGQLSRLWDVIRSTPFLDWQLLTKRPHRIAECLPADWGPGYENVWLGTSVESPAVLDRVDHLVGVPAVVHFLSVEPLIGAIPALPLHGVDWVIVGGESGPGARPMSPEWALSIRDQCHIAQVPFFFKQWGGTNKKKAGRELGGRFYNEMPAPGASGHANPKTRRDAALMDEVVETAMKARRERWAANDSCPNRFLLPDSLRSLQ
jgi:protein gp37